jgi:hypothetical protein
MNISITSQHNQNSLRVHNKKGGTIPIPIIPIPYPIMYICTYENTKINKYICMTLTLTPHGRFFGGLVRVM